MRLLTGVREWSGVVALVLVVAGGTAYAANEWTGTNIVNESLTGVDVKDNSLRGDDVAEATLARVPDSARLHGLTSAGFVQGASASPGAFGVSHAKVYFNRATGTAGGTSTFLRIPGVLHLELACSASVASVGVISDVENLDVFYANRDGSGGQTFLDAGDQLHLDADATDIVPRWDISAGTGADTFGLQKLTALSIDVVQRSAPTDCFAQAWALSQQT